jgi:hypothetical protein
MRVSKSNGPGRGKIAFLKSSEPVARFSAGILCALFNVSNSKMTLAHNLLTQIFTGC